MKKTCKNCGKEFFKKPSVSKEKWKSYIHCSRECRKIGGINFECIACHKKFHVKPHLLSIGKKFCSVYCAHNGEFSPRWKGGITGEGKLERLRFGREVRKTVLKRDHYACQMCGSKEHLQVDHIQSWSEYVELRFDINNCRTLCMSCHYEITYNKPLPKNIIWGSGFNQLFKNPLG